MSQILPSTSYGFTMRLRMENRSGHLASILNAIAETKGDPGAVYMVEADRGFKVRDLTVNARNENHPRAIVEAVPQGQLVLSLPPNHLVERRQRCRVQFPVRSRQYHSEGTIAQ